MNAIDTTVRGEPEPQRMQCMEVWGGNRETNRVFTMPGLATWVFSRPHLQASSGGDVYYLSSCASGRITRFLLADVMGHGAGASDTARYLRDLMRENINLIQQTRLVRSMNQQFSDSTEQGGFATALVGTYFAPRRSLALCNAGHPFPLLYRAAERQWSLIQRPEPQPGAPVDMPLGVIRETDYLLTETRLDPGDLLLAFSDAVIESCDRRGSLLGSEGVLAMVRQLDASRPAELISNLLERILTEDTTNLSQDDVTLLLLQVRETRPTLKANLLAPFRLFGKVTDATRWNWERFGSGTRRRDS